MGVGSYIYPHFNKLGAGPHKSITHHHHQSPLLCHRRPRGAQLPTIEVFIWCEVAQTQLPRGPTER
jgi:hypothetical protein